MWSSLAIQTNISCGSFSQKKDIFINFIISVAIDYETMRDISDLCREAMT